MSDYYDVYCVTDNQALERFTDIKDKCFDVISFANFRENFDQFDRVLYHFGNSEFHLSYFELLENYPGVVVLHEVFLDGLHALRENHFQTLFDAHGASSVYSICSEKLLQKDNYIKYPCSLEVVDQSLGLIVHSKHAGRLLRTWYGSKIAEKYALVPFLKDSTFRNVDGKKPGRIKSDTVLFFWASGPR